ncbi:STAS domain-containing protein [Nocardia sp. IFM 10818]
MSALRPPIPIMATSTMAADSTPLCTVAGEVDIRSVDALRTALAGTLREGATVIVDLSGVTFFGTPGLRALMDARDWADQHDCALWIVGSPCVKRLLEVMDLADDFGILH